MPGLDDMDARWAGQRRLSAPIEAIVRGSESAVPARHEDDRRRPATVLVVDDEADVRLALRVALRRSPCFEVVAEAATGDEALAAVRAAPPDILLLDLMLPRLDGRDVAPIIFREAPATMIVVLSGLAAEDEAAGVLTRGAFAYVEKTELGPRLADGLETLWLSFRRALAGEDVWAPSGACQPQR